MSKKLRWGIIGPGKIAHKFAQGLATLSGASLQAVASRNLEKARAFASEYGAQTAHGSYEDLAQDPDVDIVYVATPHPYHKEVTLLCLSHGKHVLCEKPLSLNAQDGEEMFRAAEENGVFLMEAMWTRFLPAWRQVRQWLDEGAIGEVQLLIADFCFRSSTWDLTDRKFAPELGGGALLDIGIYPIATAYFIFGEEPVAVQSTATLGATGTDDQSSYLFRYHSGAQAVLTSSFLTDGPKEAIICGTKGKIRVPLFWKAEEAILEVTDEAPVIFDGSYQATGLQFQAEAIAADLAAGKLENDIMPASETLRVARMMDRLREDWGLKYPQEG